MKFANKIFYYFVISNRIKYMSSVWTDEIIIKHILI